MVKYKLTYFNVKGLGEPIRLLLAYLGEEFEDIRIDFADWPHCKANYKYGQLPVLEIDGKEIYQSGAICRYLGKKAGLAGQDDWEALLVDQTVDLFIDFKTEFNKYYREQDLDAKGKLKDILFKEKIPLFFSKFEDQIKTNNGYLVNGKMTWADIFVAPVFQSMNEILETEITAPYLHLHQLINKVNTHPKFKDYVDNRPPTLF